MTPSMKSIGSLQYAFGFWVYIWSIIIEGSSREFRTLQVKPLSKLSHTYGKGRANDNEKRKVYKNLCGDRFLESN